MKYDANNAAERVKDGGKRVCPVVRPMDMKLVRVEGRVYL